MAKTETLMTVPDMESLMAEPDLFEIEFRSNNNEKLPILLFQEIEADLCDRLMHSNSSEVDQTDWPLEFIQNTVDNLRI